MREPKLRWAAVCQGHTARSGRWAGPGFQGRGWSQSTLRRCPGCQAHPCQRVPLTGLQEEPEIPRSHCAPAMLTSQGSRLPCWVLGPLRLTLGPPCGLCPGAATVPEGTGLPWGSGALSARAAQPGTPSVPKPPMSPALTYLPTTFGTAGPPRGAPGPCRPPPRLCSRAHTGVFVHAAPSPSTSFLLPHQTSAFTATCMSQLNGRLHQEAPLEAPGLDQERLWAPPAPCVSHHSSAPIMGPPCSRVGAFSPPLHVRDTHCRPGPSGHAPHAAPVVMSTAEGKLRTEGVAAAGRGTQARLPAATCSHLLWASA